MVLLVSMRDVTILRVQHQSLLSNSTFSRSSCGKREPILLGPHKTSISTIMATLWTIVQVSTRAPKEGYGMLPKLLVVKSLLNGGYSLLGIDGTLSTYIPGSTYLVPLQISLFLIFHPAPSRPQTNQPSLLPPANSQ